MLKLLLKAYVALIGVAFMLFFVPWALNANNSLINGLGVAVIATAVVGGFSFLFKQNTNKEQ